jgi:alpha-glucosidase (family GH31 glycosyl hydrolase)
MMIIDNWSDHEKKPFSYGEPYTSYNRAALKLKSRLMPYLYTFAHESHVTGMPVQRALVLEFPEDPNTWTEAGGNARAKYEFMSGPSFLVAPVFADTTAWSVYLPPGRWTDYASGEVFEGGVTITGYDVSDFKLPVLVREGAIIPMYPESYYEERVQQRPRDPLQVDVYPHPAGATEFMLFEDDGLTYRFRENEFNTTRFSCDAVSEPGTITIDVAGCMEGEGYEGMPPERNYHFTVHCDAKPRSVTRAEGSRGRTRLREMADVAELQESVEGWRYDPARGGVLHIKLGPLPYDAMFTIDIRKGR